MLTYAMIVLFLVSIAAVPFSLESYVKRRDPRHLFLLAYGWTAYAISFPIHAIDQGAGRPLLVAGFGAAQLLGVTLIVSGALSYFVALRARRIAAIATLGAATVFVLLYLFPGVGGLVIVGENVLLLSAAILGLVMPRRFKATGGTSYYWLMVVLGMGVLAALAWLPAVAGAPTNEPVLPWLGTTAVVVAIFVFLVHLEYSSTLIVLAERERELLEYRGNLERLVEDRTAELREAAAAKTQFLAKMSHELRTPLNSIIGFSGTLKQGLAGPLTDEQVTQVEMINRSGTHLLSLIDDVLDIASIDAGRSDVHISYFDPEELAREALEIIRPLAIQKGLELRFEVTPEVGSMESDPGKIRQILLNLLGNAVKFTETGSVTVSVSTDRSTVTFTVTDTGPGIDAAALPVVFEPFTQGELDNGMRPQGTGLGLAICREFTIALGGLIDVASEPGSGSSFVVTLPRTLTAAEDSR